MKCVLAGWLMAAAMAASAAQPPFLSEGAGRWHLLGQGEMRWFGLRLYEASLWSDEKGYSPDKPFALTLTYARSISSARIVEASMTEMRRLGAADEARLARWQVWMQQAFPDVEEGDSITGVSLADGRVQFWSGGRLRAEFSDAAFARAFFAIWLDPRTREPGLRARLLGAK